MDATIKLKVGNLEFEVCGSEEFVKGKFKEFIDEIYFKFVNNSINGFQKEVEIKEEKKHDGRKVIMEDLESNS